MSLEPRPATSVRKLQPLAQLPDAETLRKFSPGELKLLRRRLRETVECVYNPLFEQPEIEHELLGPIPPSPADDVRAADNDDSGMDLLAGITGRALTCAQERHLFLRLNYCRYRVMKVLKESRSRRLGVEAIRELLRWEYATLRCRGDLVRINLPLVLAMARRARITGVDQADLISEGNLALLRSVDKFDCERGFKFSTYACRAILKSFSRVAVRTARYRGYFPTEFDPTLEKSTYLDQQRNGLESECVDELKSILGQNLAKLNPIEERVIRARFALDEPLETEDGRPPRAKTLEQVGELIGVTKERVRQIQNKALIKIRLALEENVLAS